MNDPRRNVELRHLRARVEVHACDQTPQQGDRGQWPACHLARGSEWSLEDEHRGRMLDGKLGRNGAAKRVSVERDASGIDAQLLAGEPIGRSGIPLR